MSQLWFYFAVNVFTQLLIFLIYAHSEKRLADVPRLLALGLLSAIIPGPLCDLIGGKYLGLGEYALGFGPLSLTMNTVFMYSIFAAYILLMQKTRILQFCIWIFVYAAVFEVTNLFFPMWTWAFAVPSVEYVVVSFGSTLAIAVAFALAWHTLFGYRFVFIDNIFKSFKKTAY